MTLIRKTYKALNYQPSDDGGGYWVMLFIQSLIFVNVLAVTLESVDSIVASVGKPFFHGVEIVSICIFSIEYVARLWSIVEDARYRDPLWGRLRFAFTPLALIDLLAIVPFFIVPLSLDLRVVRMVRMIRIFRLGKLGRYSKALHALGRVLKRQRDELLSAFFLFCIAMVVSASLVYFAEAEAQPGVFSSIPAAMWWAVVTLTTVGYGDVVPITAWGRLVAMISSVLGVTLFALLAGILVTGFVEEIRRAPENEL